MAGGVAVICVTLAVLALVDRAWLDCAGDLEAGGRFASRFELLVLVLPATLLATTLAAAIPATALRHAGIEGQVVADGVALSLVAALALIVAVPHPFRTYPDDVVGGVEMAPRCGPGGIPTWWPAGYLESPGCIGGLATGAAWLGSPSLEIEERR